MRQRRMTVVGFCSVLLLLLIVLVTGPACKKETAPVARSDIQDNVPPPATPSGDEPAMVEGKIALRILYVGLPNTERQQDFVSFLSRNFQSVQTADLYAFKEEQAQGSDVVLLDKDGIQWGSDGGGKPLSDIRVSNRFTRSTVSLGIPGAFWTDRMALKTGYMWNCITDAAHGESFEHEIFKTPRRVDINLESVKTPGSYFRNLPSGLELGKTLQVWNVQDTGNNVGKAGAVSDIIRPKDGPDAEALLLGFAPGKPYLSTGIGRHGNFLQWGWSAPPSKMTPAGQALFVNSICYIRKFDGVAPVQRR